ncbi:MAG: sulfatase-like hydrolase/transferase [Planctomycetales bacterium]
MYSTCPIRLVFACLVGAACAAIVSPDAARAADEARAAKPNILIILSDDQGWMDIGYHGSEVKTPNLDRLAKAGVRLDRHYVCPTCSPPRVGLLTGRFPSRFGVLAPIAGDSTQALPAGTVTLPGALQRAGYFTAMTGKWHLGLRPEVGPNAYGFDSSYGYLHGQVDPYTHRYKYGDRTWHRDGKLFEEEGHSTDLITNEAVRVVEQSAAGDKPFFLYVAYGVPHHPLAEPEEWLAKYDGEKFDDPWRKIYAASITHMDAGIGRILGALDKSGQRANTLVLFTSDNGGQDGYGAPKREYEGRYEPHTTLGNNKPLRGWKTQLHEGGIRVPAFVHWPGKLEPRVVEQALNIVDWYPTFAKLAGVPVDPEWKLEGLDVWPALLGKRVEQLDRRTQYWNTGSSVAVRVGPWKLIERRRGNDRAPELFDLAKDPFEKENLAATQPERLAELRQILTAQIARDGER